MKARMRARIYSCSVTFQPRLRYRQLDPPYAHFRLLPIVGNGLLSSTAYGTLYSSKDDGSPLKAGMTRKGPSADGPQQ